MSDVGSFRPDECFQLWVTVEAPEVTWTIDKGYVEIVRRNDEALGDLWRAIQGDPELRDSTALVVLPEFGRDADLNSRRGLDHGDGSNDLEYVTATCWGPDFARNRIVIGHKNGRHVH